jgi:hypothetical protein
MTHFGQNGVVSLLTRKKKDMEQKDIVLVYD